MRRQPLTAGIATASSTLYSPSTLIPPPHAHLPTTLTSSLLGFSHPYSSAANLPLPPSIGGTTNPRLRSASKLHASLLGNPTMFACSALSKGCSSDVAGVGGVMGARNAVTLLEIVDEMGEAVSSANASARSSAGVSGLGARELRTLDFLSGAGAGSARFEVPRSSSEASSDSSSSAESAS